MQLESIPLPESDYLYYQKSQIENAGNGLFTAIKIYKGEIIAIFYGEEIEQIEVERRATKNQHAYFMNLPNGNILDCQLHEGFAKYANDAEALKPFVFKNNAIITISEDDEVCLVAKRIINPNEEIFCSYGKRYWEGIELNKESE